MKHAKALGIASLAAILLVVVFGGGSAAAVQICKTVSPGTGDGKCATASDEKESDEPATSTSTNAVFTTSVTNHTCSSSSMTVDPTASTGSPITGSVTNLSFAHCTTSGGTACTMTVLNLPYHVVINAGSLTITDPTGAGAKMVCGFLINCTLSSKEISAQYTHDGDATVAHLSGVKMERSGGFCPETAEFHATYFFHGLTIT